MYSRLSSPSKQTKTLVKEVYPEDIECVKDSLSGAGGIYISNLEAAQNLRTLNRLGIKAVITAANGACLGHSRRDIPHYKYIPGEDHESYDLAKYFEQSVRFLQENLKRTNVLVHCMAGISRSVTLVLAYLIKSEGMDYETAYSLIKNRRRIIRPNNGFVRQLKNFEREIRSKNRSLQSEKAYATPQRRYQTPETRYIVNNPNPQLDSTDKSNNSKFAEQQTQTKTYSITNIKRSTTHLNTCNDLDMGNEKEIDLKIAEIRKKYALPERKHSVFFEREPSSQTRSPLISTDRNTDLFKTANNWAQLKPLTEPYVSKRFKTSQRYDNQMETDLLKQPTLKDRNTMFASGIGIGLPIRKKITMDEHKYMIGRY